MDLFTFIKTEFARQNSKIEQLENLVRQIPTTHNSTLGEWLSEEQTKELLQRGTTSLWELRKRKILKFKKLGGRTYYNHQSIIDFLDKK